MAKLKRTAQFYYTYQTKNIITGKTYIGVHSTDNINDGYIGCGVRSLAYAKSSVRNGVKSHFIRAVCKYGYDNFKSEILSFFDTLEEAYEEEKFLVDRKWVDDNSNYNLSLGGYGGGTPSGLSEKEIEYAYKLYMNGEFLKDIANKLGTKKHVVYRALSNFDKKGRKNKIRFDKNLKFIKDFYEKEIIARHYNGDSKEFLNKQYPFDLNSSGILKDKRQKPKYVSLVKNNLVFFSTKKDFFLKTGLEINLGSVKNACLKKWNHIGLSFMFYDDYIKDSVFIEIDDSTKRGVHFGKIVYINNKKKIIDKPVREFCDENGIAVTSLNMVLLGKRKELKNISLEKIKEDS